MKEQDRELLPILNERNKGNTNNQGKQTQAEEKTNVLMEKLVSRDGTSTNMNDSVISPLRSDF